MTESQCRTRGERRDAGDTLIEILISVVITGLTVGALLASLAGAGSAGNVQRSGVLADVVMRNFADATKVAARDCTPGEPLSVPGFTRPAGYVPTFAGPVVPTCPSVSATAVLTLAVSGPLNVLETMQIQVRRP